MSAHADQAEILRWLGGFKRAPRMTFLVHGEIAAMTALQSTITAKLGWPTLMPEHQQRVDLQLRGGELKALEWFFMKSVLLLMLMGAAMASGCGGGSGSNTPTAAEAPRPAAPDTTNRKYLLERVDDAAVVQLYADGFDRLPLGEKTLIWHLYQAALAGRDIFYDQRYAHNLEMRSILEEIITHANGIDAATLAEIQRYTKLFWINTGPYNNLTARKFILKSTPEAFAAAAATAQKNGATFPLQGGESLDALLKRLQPVFFDLNVDPIVTNKTPGKGKDILASSANNLYVGVTTKDLAGYDEKYQLNSRVVKKDGKIVEEVYRVGGKYDAQIRAIIQHLEAAIPFATEPMAKALRALVKFYQTGEMSDRIAYDIAWVEDKASPVDTINGFVEVYMDARGMKGSWESLVFYVNPEKTAEIRKLAADAQWFEDRMPWAAQYRKQGRHRHHGECHRRGRRSRRFRTDHAGRDQPAERSEHP